MADLVIKGGLVVDPGGSYHADVAIRGERIAAVGVGLHGEREIDASGLFVIPGAIDPHVHLQMPLAGRVSADTFASGTQAALCGGTTTVIDFVTPEPGQPMLEALRRRQEEADGSVAADYGLHMTVPTWHAADTERLAEIPAVARQGCPTFKMYQAYAGMMLDDVALHRAMSAVAAIGGRVVLHSETGPLLDALREQALAGHHTEPIWHAATRPARLEASAVHRAVEVAAVANCSLYIFHVGAKESVEEVRRACRRGVAVHAETCPQYLLLSAGRHLGGQDGELYVCAPPLRSETDQETLWQALGCGDISVVSTDHCPWLRAEKQQPDFTQIPGGLPSIEARLSLVHHFGVGEGRLSLERWVDVCCNAPARLMGLETKGRIAAGFDADLVLFDPARRKRIDVATLHEAAGWTPYAGMEVQGWPRTVLLRGRVAVQDETPVLLQGGRFVARRLVG